MKKFSAIAVLSVFLLVFLVAHAATNGIKFKSASFKDAASVAKTENKLILVFIRTQTCQTSKRMDEVFKNPELGKFINENFVAVEMDPDIPMNNIRVSNWGATGVPTYVFLSPTKDKLLVSKGFKDASQFLDEAEKAMKSAGFPVIGKPKIASAKEKGSSTEVIYDDSDDDDDKE